MIKEKKTMKSHRNTLYLMTLAASTAATLLLADAVFAKSYTRSCRGHVRFEPTSFRGNSWSFEFTGKGTIGFYAPNTARKRAARNLNECFDAAWERRYIMSRPSQCSESNQVYNYPVNGALATQLQINMCRLNPGRASMVVRMWVLTDGDRGCFKNLNSPWVHASNYTVNCPGTGFEPNTDRPGMDIRNFDLPRAEPELCLEECTREARCQAWTYVRPGVQGPSARCWLKNGVPPARRNNCCTSGVKEEP